MDDSFPSCEVIINKAVGTVLDASKNGEPALRSVLGAMLISNWELPLNRYIIGLENLLSDFI